MVCSHLPYLGLPRVALIPAHCYCNVCISTCLQCREAIFDTLIKEVLHPSEKLPLRHLAVQELADHIFQLGEPSHLPASGQSVNVSMSVHICGTQSCMLINVVSVDSFIKRALEITSKMSRLLACAAAILCLSTHQCCHPFLVRCIIRNACQEQAGAI